MNGLVSIEISNHVADVKLNRPQKLNALSIEMFDAIAAAAHSLVEDTSVRAVVLSGEGKGFCAGIDLQAMQGQSEVIESFLKGSSEFPNRFQAPAWAWRKVPVPVICALHGVAFGGGLQIALGADIRIAHPETQMSVMEIKWGIIPDMSASQTLRDVVRLDVAKELTFSGRIVQADEAQTLGLVTSVSSNAYEAAHEMAAQIAGQNPDAISLAKYLLDNTRNEDETHGLQLEEKLQQQIMMSANQREAVMSQMQKRAAQFAERQHVSLYDDKTRESLKIG
jgi:enoyl-CoA hydratase/carnithine racemase